MRRITWMLSALALLLGPAVQSEAGGDAARRMGEYRLTDLDGVEHTLTEHRGEIVVVNFWASWCAPCRKELPVLDAWNTEWSSRGARVAAISVDSSLRKVRRFVEETGLGLEVYHDGPEGLAEQLDLPYLPCTYVLDRSGEIVLMSEGSDSDALERVRNTVERLLSASAAVSVQTASDEEGAR